MGPKHETATCPEFTSKDILSEFLTEDKAIASDIESGMLNQAVPIPNHIDVRTANWQNQLSQMRGGGAVAETVGRRLALLDHVVEDGRVSWTVFRDELRQCVYEQMVISSPHNFEQYFYAPSPTQIIHSEDPMHIAKRVGYGAMRQESALIAALDHKTEIEKEAREDAAAVGRDESSALATAVARVTVANAPACHDKDAAIDARIMTEVAMMSERHGFIAQLMCRKLDVQVRAPQPQSLSLCSPSLCFHRMSRWPSNSMTHYFMPSFTESRVPMESNLASARRCFFKWSATCSSPSPTATSKRIGGVCSALYSPSVDTLCLLNIC